MKRLSIRLLVALLVAIVLAGGMALPASADAYSDRVLADNPSLYWRLNETSGSSFADSSGNGVTGSFVAWPGHPAPTHAAPGVVDGDASWLTNDSGRITGDDGDIFPPSDVFTIETWIKTTWTDGGWIAGFRDGIGNHDRMLFMDKSGRIGFGVHAGSPKVVRSSSPYNDGEWHLLTATLGPTGQRLYIDGALNAVDTSTTTAHPYSGNWSLGCEQWDFSNWSGPGTVDSECVAASLDELAVWNSTALDATQIAGHYAQVMNGNAVGANVNPSMTFTVAGRPTACNGATPTAGSSSSGTSVGLGRIGASTAGTAAQDLTVSTNAANGFALRARTSGALGNGSGHTIADLPHFGWWDTAAFPSTGTEAFGYTLSWFGPNAWTALGASDSETTSGSGPGVVNDCIAYRAQAGPTTPAGTYSTTVIYTAVARY